jgi:hypothetical protein
MKKIFFILISIASMQYLRAQEPADALRFSWYAPNGTARQQAIGGAGGSLGGDISATFINPAGLGFYKTGDFVLTPAYRFSTNKASYFGRTEKEERDVFSFGTSGVVFGNADRKNKSSAIALAINQTANFNSDILYRGLNTESSYSQKFLEEIANNKDNDPSSVAQNYPFGTSLAFNTFWIDTANGWTSGNKQFVSLATPLLAHGGLLQQQTVKNRGGITEISLAGAFNYNEKFLIGGAIGIPFLHYKKESTFIEADPTTDDNNFDFGTITENLTTSGAGFNVKLGAIYKPVEYIRLGLAIHTPTFYSLTDEYNSSVTTNTENYQHEWTQNSADFTGGKDAEFKYNLRTPYRVMISGSYVFREVEDVRKQKGFVTADIEYTNYKASSYSTSNDGDNTQTTKDYLKSLNTAIDNAYKGAFNFRLGGELKFTTFMVRLGGAYYGNPYKDLAGEKGSRFQLSGGLGYRNKGFFIDVAYMHTMGKDVHFPYRLQSSQFTPATLKQTGGNAVLTIGFKI